MFIDPRITQIATSLSTEPALQNIVLLDSVGTGSQHGFPLDSNLLANMTPDPSISLKYPTIQPQTTPSVWDPSMQFIPSQDYNSHIYQHLTPPMAIPNDSTDLNTLYPQQFTTDHPELSNHPLNDMFGANSTELFENAPSASGTYISSLAPPRRIHYPYEDLKNSQQYFTPPLSLSSSLTSLPTVSASPTRLSVRPTISYNGEYRVSKKKRPNHSQRITRTLDSWLEENINHPYPSEAEKKRLMAITNLKRSQLKNWFGNARRRLIQKIVDKDGNVTWVKKNKAH
ncbi:DNA binding [Mycoemilia scoparia]|uniref:DNA binding n=1 Tax=Mycoemilia scoparia TaxID=417184 RepID=A0A9W8DRM0_9FUNG|nr:DNA binding [Mycoemilia scoparia]